MAKKRPKTTCIVECATCGAVFRARVGWTRVDNNVVLEMNRRGLANKVTFRRGGVQNAPIDLMRVALRWRQCLDHAEGTEGCTGSLSRADNKPIGAGTPPPAE